MDELWTSRAQAMENTACLPQLAPCLDHSSPTDAEIRHSNWMFKSFPKADISTLEKTGHFYLGLTL